MTAVDTRTPQHNPPDGDHTITYHRAPAEYRRHRTYATCSCNHFTTYAYLSPDMARADADQHLTDTRKDTPA